MAIGRRYGQKYKKYRRPYHRRKVCKFCADASLRFLKLARQVYEDSALLPDDQFHGVLSWPHVTDGHISHLAENILDVPVHFRC